MMSFDKIFFTFFSIFVIFLLSSCPIDPDDSNGNKNKNDNNKTSNSLIEFLTLLQTTAVSGGSYTYELKADEVITPQNLSYSGKENITITLRGDNTNRTISLSTNGAMFTVRSGVTLVLDNNLTLQGRVSNNNALVVVAADAMLIMNHGVIITGNTNTSSRGGGVVLSLALTALGQNEGGKFIMNGGEIINNRALGAGGGVAISSTAAFTMKNGKISGNSTVTSLLTTTGNGGGVLAYGNFVMEGGEISGNSVSSSSASGANGGGVYVEQTDFTMKGGKIFGNTATSSGSTSNASGGGVYVAGTTGFPATFKMEGGEIFGNTVTASLLSRGGGVRISNGSSQSESNSFFIKTGGIITGFTDDSINENVVRINDSTIRNNYGHAVFFTNTRRKESTIGITENLDSSIPTGW